MGFRSMIQGLFRSEVERTGHHEFGHSMVQRFYHGELHGIHIGVSGMGGYTSFKPLDNDSQYLDVIVAGMVQESLFDNGIPSVSMFKKHTAYSGDYEIVQKMGFSDLDIEHSIVRVESILDQPKVQEYIKSKIPELVYMRDMSGSEIQFPQ